VALIARLQPDELLVGYLGHVGALNGRRTRGEVAQLFGGCARGASVQGAQMLDAIALENDLSTAQLIAKHTCFPITRRIQERVSADRDDPEVRYVTVVRSNSEHLSLCPTCVAEDLESGQTAYWRRRHQVPGRYRCPVHLQPLVLVPERELMTDRLEDLEGETLTFEHSEAHAERAMEILDMMLASGLRINRDRCMKSMRMELLRCGIDPSEPRWFARFSAAIDDAFSLPWLRFAFPRAKFLEKRLRTFAMGCISDRALPVSHTAVAVTAAMVFPSADAAISAFTSP